MKHDENVSILLFGAYPLTTETQNRVTYTFGIFIQREREREREDVWFALYIIHNMDYSQKFQPA